MYIKKLDYLSPPITFYYSGSLSHSSIVSGILSIFSFILIIVISIYFSRDLIQRKNPTAFYYNHFVDDSGIFPMNSSSLFHYISLQDAKNNHRDGGVDFTIFRVIGIETFFTRYLNDSNLNNFNHWLYGPCKNINIEGLKYLITNDYFEKSACIIKYFSKEKQKYFDIDDFEFKWPSMAHGTYNSNSKFYSIFLEICKENTVNLILGEDYHCTNEEKLKERIGITSGAHLYYIDHYVDVLNYDNPNTKFINRIENSIQLNNYPVNHLNFDPSLVKTHNGLIFDNIKYEKTYIYERNDVFTYETGNSYVYTVYYFWLSNNEKYYERSYKRIQEVISNIGGINQVITTFAFILNKLYNNFIILSDTKNLLFSLIDSEQPHSSKRKKIRKSESLKIVKNNESMKQNSNLIKKSDLEKSINKFEKNINQSDYSFPLSQSNNNLYKNESNIKYNNDEKFNYKFNITFNNIKEKHNFWNFILFKISCEKKYNFFRTFQKFRMKLLSEEHMIRNHLNIYKLLNISKTKNCSRIKSLHLKDLYELI
jgi:hypothetical protein